MGRKSHRRAQNHHNRSSMASPIGFLQYPQVVSKCRYFLSVGRSQRLARSRSLLRNQGAVGEQPGEITIKWAKERLLSMDPVQRCFSYEVVDNNFGFNSYVATIEVIPTDGGGCLIDLSFVSGPMEGWRMEDLGCFIDSCLQFMAEKMEAAIKNGDGS